MPPPPKQAAPAPAPAKNNSARNWTIAVGVIIALIVIGALNKNSDSSTTTHTEDTGIDSGLGTNDASGDVTLSSCHDGGQYAHTIVECKVTIHNTSDGTSDYYIEAQAQRDGVVIGGLINAAVSSVPGGGTAEAKLTGVADGTWDSVRLITVQRTAS